MTIENFVSEAFRWAFVFFVVGTGLFASIALAAYLFRVMLERVLETATLLEAASEAHRQGRMPIMRMWKWVRRE